MAALALAGALLCAGCRQNDSVPPFVMKPAASQSGSAGAQDDSSETAQPLDTQTSDTQSTLDPQTSDTQTNDTQASPDTQPHSEREEPPAMLTSYDPRHYFLFEFNEHSLTVTGVYDGSDVSSVYLASTLEYTAAPVYSGDEFRAELDYGEPKDGLDLLNITMTDISLSENFWVNVVDGRVLPIDTAGFAAETEKAANAPRTLPTEGTLAYIDSELDPERIESALKQVREISDEVCTGIDDDYEKLHALSYWVSANICYDFDARENLTEQTLCLSHILETHRTVCGGYANLLAALCAAQDIPCTLVRGEASPGRTFANSDVTGAYHEWVFAEINGRRVWVDPVWNSPNSYSHGKYRVYNIAYERYFDITPEVLALDHIVHFCETRDYFGAGASFG